MSKALSNLPSRRPILTRVSTHVVLETRGNRLHIRPLGHLGGFPEESTHREDIRLPPEASETRDPRIGSARKRIPSRNSREGGWTPPSWEGPFQRMSFLF